MSDSSQLSTQTINDVTNLCQNPQTKGFDLQAGQSWIYPTNYPVRDYQYNIVQQALHKNTLVCLPTGLGKTFIAAVVMYNFYRWYPHGKIIFMAPTRPLVKQQIDACYDITGISAEVTAELTGSTSQGNRADIWKSKRVFFITPHILQNDLKTFPELGEKIKCLVFDEAHRAKGNHAYCEVIRNIVGCGAVFFRVLALSATPGNSGNDVVEVIRNLRIAHVEFRTEESLDVREYVFSRSLETVVVPLGEKLQKVKEDYIKILDKYTRILIQYKVLQGNCSNLTKGYIFMVKQSFQQKNRGAPHYAEIMKSLTVCMTLYHAYEVLIRHGLRGFLTFFEEHINDPLIKSVFNLIPIMEEVRDYLGPTPNVQPLPDGSFVPIPKESKFGHPKFYRLRDLLVEHFQSSAKESKVIVFFEYRDSVTEAYSLLIQSTPLIRSKILLGQGSGVTQKIQTSVITSFREGTCNTLLSTCIGEEGLDVGEVNLIICFDVSTKSASRMVQRMGRTGRKQAGRIIVMVTEGKEQQTLKDCLVYKNNLASFVFDSQLLNSAIFKDNPVMIPEFVKPKCEKMKILVTKKATKRTDNRIKSMFDAINYDNVPLVEITECIPCNRTLLSDSFADDFTVDFCGKNLEKQRTHQNLHVTPSKSSQILVALLQFADSKRFNIPVNQNAFGHDVISNTLIQGDIRNMFARTTATQLLSQQPFSQHLSEKDPTKKYNPELFTELSNYLALQMLQSDQCRVCSDLFECATINDFIGHHRPNVTGLTNWTPPDLSILDEITEGDLTEFRLSLNPKHCYDFGDEDDDILAEIEIAPPDPDDNIMESLAFEAPKGFDKVLKLVTVTQGEEKTVPVNRLKSLLGFFQLSSVEELFDSQAKSPKLEPEPEPNDPDQTIIAHYQSPPHCSSPDVFEESPDLFPASPAKRRSLDIIGSSSGSRSPILSGHDRLRCLKEKVKKNLFNRSKVPLTEVSEFEAKSTKEEVVAKSDGHLDVSDICDLSIFGLSKKYFGVAAVRQNLLIDDACDVTPYKLSDGCPQGSPRSKTKSGNLSISDVCDISSFLDVTPDKLSLSDRDKCQNRPESITKLSVVDVCPQGSPQGEKLSISDVCDVSSFLDVTPEKLSLNRSDRSLNRPNSVTFSRADTGGASQKPKALNLSISDVCDVSSLLDVTPDIDNRPTEPRQKKPKTVNLSISDVCDVSCLLDVTPDIDHRPTEPEQKKPKIVNLSISDVCDVSSFLDITPLSPTKPSDRLSEIGEICALSAFLPPPKTTVKNSTSVIIISDSDSTDVENTPTKNRTSMAVNKTPTQLSVTQMVNKIEHINSVKRGKLDQKKNGGVGSKVTVLHISDSDDDFFEEKSQILPKSKSKLTQLRTPERTSSQSQSRRPSKISLEPVKVKRRICHFIDNEAVLSQGEADDSLVVSGDESSGGDDNYDSSFVEDLDETVNLPNTQMRAQYLQSTRSPVISRGKFKIPAKPKWRNVDVFSQPVDQDDSYLNDTFVVDNEDVSVRHDLSQLDILELKLKQQRKLKKNKNGGKRKADDAGQNTKRRRVMVVSDSDSD